MELKKMTLDELNEEIETYENRVETSQDYIESATDPLIKATMIAKLHEYKRALQILYLEMERRGRESAI